MIDPGTIRDDINVDFFGGDRVVEVKIDRFGVGWIDLDIVWNFDLSD